MSSTSSTSQHLPAPPGTSQHLPAPLWFTVVSVTTCFREVSGPSRLVPPTTQATNTKQTRGAARADNQTGGDAPRPDAQETSKKAVLNQIEQADKFQEEEIVELALKDIGLI